MESSLSRLGSFITTLILKSDCDGLLRFGIAIVAYACSVLQAAVGTTDAVLDF